MWVLYAYKETFWRAKGEKTSQKVMKEILSISNVFGRVVGFSLSKTEACDRILHISQEETSKMKKRKNFNVKEENDWRNLYFETKKTMPSTSKKMWVGKMKVIFTASFLFCRTSNFSLWNQTKKIENLQVIKVLTSTLRFF